MKQLNITVPKINTLQDNNQVPKLKLINTQPATIDAENCESLILIYSGTNTPIGDSPPIVGSFRTIPEIKELAPKTKNIPVVFFVQGYEKSETGKWRTARYVIHNGIIEDETNKINGARPVYDEDNNIIKREPASDEDACLFEKSTFNNFLNDAFQKFPTAHYRIMFWGSHGRGAKGFSGERVANGAIDLHKYDRLPLNDFKNSFDLHKLDLLDLDCCLAGQFEVIDKLCEISSYIIASPETEAFFGNHPYSDTQPLLPMYKEILDDPKISPEKLGKLIIQKNSEMTDIITDENNIPTLALYSTKQLPQLNELIAVLGEKLSKALEDKNLKKSIIEAQLFSFCYKDNNFIDLKSFLKQLKKNGVLESCVMSDIDEKINNVMEKMTIDMYKGNRERNYSHVGPLSIFVPAKPSTLTQEPGKNDKYIENLHEYLNAYSSLDTTPYQWQEFIGKLSAIYIDGTIT